MSGEASQLEAAVLHIERLVQFIDLQLVALEQRIRKQEEWAAQLWVAPRTNTIISGQVNGCAGQPFPGATVQIKDHVSGAVYATVTATSLGLYAASIKLYSNPQSIDIVATPTGTYAARFAASATQNISAVTGTNSVPTLTIPPATGYCCGASNYYPDVCPDYVIVPCCTNPVKQTLHTSDGLGTHALAYIGGNQWQETTTTTGYAPGAGDCTSTGNMTVTYTLTCANPGWQLQIAWALTVCGTSGPGGGQYGADGNNPGFNFPVAVSASASSTVCDPFALSFDMPTSGSNSTIGLSTPTPGGGGIMDVTP